MRRDKNDKLWAKVKQELTERDGTTCRLVRILSVNEMAQLRRNAGHRIKILDPAHYIAVSANPDIMYDIDNLVKLNRYSHEMLDSFKDPISGKGISKGEVNKWWYKIVSSYRPQFDNLKMKELI